MKFETVQGQPIDDLPKYIRDFVRYENGLGREIQIMVGTDSLARGKYTLLVSVIVLYRIRNGAHIIRWVDPYPRENNIIRKLKKETARTMQIVAYLLEHVPDYAASPWVHFDLNSNPEHFSNKLVSESVGWAIGIGIPPEQVAIKPLAYAATHVADNWCRKD